MERIYIGVIHKRRKAELSVFCVVDVFYSSVSSVFKVSTTASQTVVPNSLALA
jgi:hypothetical protein